MSEPITALNKADITYVSTPRIACNGSPQAGKHPKVYLTMTADGNVVCPYCSRVFVQENSGETSHAH